EHGTLLLQAVHHELVVDDLVAHVDRLVVMLQGTFDGDDGTIDSRAVAARLGKKDGSGAHASHRRSGSTLVGGRWGKTHHPSTGRAHPQRPRRRSAVRCSCQSGPMTQTSPEPGTDGDAAPRPALAATAAQTTAENPWPLRQLSVKVGEYVARMSPLWVEGEIVQLNRRPGSGLSFMTLRDIDVDMSFSVPVREHVLRALPVEPVPGARVVIHAKPTFWTKRGTLQLEADDIRPVGLGELLARLEQLKRVL